ncbi:MAG: hypothetical protein GC182_06425 [Rhodopseudomonas sp.]|nr:hypothetical protein [Rhodopseudomonas sp.]
MAKRKEIEATGNDDAAAPRQTPSDLTAPPLSPANDAGFEAGSEPTDAEKAAAKAAAKAALLRSLTVVDSPSISPAVSEAVAVDGAANGSKAVSRAEPEAETGQSAHFFPMVPVVAPASDYVRMAANPPPPRFVLKARHKRYARLAASVAIGAVIGVVIGTVATRGLSSVGGKTAPAVNVAAQEENKAMQQSLTRLTKDVTTLKANLAAARKQAQDRTEQLRQARAEITGSISAPQTVAAAHVQTAMPSAPPVLSAAPATVQAATPLPAPRPSQRVAAFEAPPPGRLSVVPDWSIHDVRGGYVYVEGHGDIYQVVPGAPLPGLGPVQAIKRVEGRWVVTTPRGIIVTNHERRFFD